MDLKEYLQNKKMMQEAQEQIQPAICHICGSINAKLYAATSNDTWVAYRIAYSKDRRRYLCDKCVKIYRPSTSLSLEKKDKNGLKHVSIHDSDGNLFPYTTQFHLKLMPQWYPLDYLGDEELEALQISVTHISDCFVLKLIPLNLDECSAAHYYISQHVKMFGYIYTSCPEWYRPTQFNQPHYIRFHSYWDRNGNKKHVSLIYHKESR